MQIFVIEKTYLKSAILDCAIEFSAKPIESNKSKHVCKANKIRNNTAYRKSQNRSKKFVTRLRKTQNAFDSTRMFRKKKTLQQTHIFHITICMLLPYEKRPHPPKHFHPKKTSNSKWTYQLAPKLQRRAPRRRKELLSMASSKYYWPFLRNTIYIYYAVPVSGTRGDVLTNWWTDALWCTSYQKSNNARRRPHYGVVWEQYQHYNQNFLVLMLLACCWLVGRDGRFAEIMIHVGFFKSDGDDSYSGIVYVEEFLGICSLKSYQ